VSVLYLVRHGQASYGAADYDALSPRGEAQAAALGTYWGRLGIRFDRCWVGPRRRHRQTYERAASACRALGLELPPATALDELDEHSGQQLLHGAGGGTLAAIAAGDRQEHLRAFRHMMRRWVRGEIETPAALEPWASFRRRATAAVERITAAAGRGSRIVAFTSGGPIACAAGAALGLDDEAVMELSWWLRNGSVTELLFDRRRTSMIAFNASPHVTDPDLLTHI